MKKILLFSSLLLCLSLTACGGQEQESSTDKNHEHSFGEWTVVTEATCTQSGSQKRSCSCGAVETLDISVLNHTYGDWVVDAAPTCTQVGQQSRVCACGEKEVSELEMTEHNYNPVSIVEPTPTDPDGSVTYTCDDCGDSYTDKVKTDGSEGLTYVVLNNSSVPNACAIVSIGSCTDKSLIIPKYIDGYKVIQIAKEAFYDNDDITDVVLPDSILYIEENAFGSCSNLTSVKLQEGLLTIGVEAFHWCLRLSDIEIPSTVEYIGNMAFRGCKFTKAVIPDSIKVLDSDVFDHCTNLTELVISENVTEIPDSIFEGCSKLTNVVIPSKVTRIGFRAFDLCKGLESITIPQTVTFIGRSAFGDCSSLKEIHFGGTMAEWNAIEKYEEWDDATGFYTVYCTDGEIQKSIT